MPDQQKFGITHYKDLKKHPKLLNYTMSLIRSREKSVDDIENIRKQSIKENLRMSINNMSQIASLNDSQNT